MQFEAYRLNRGVSDTIEDVLVTADEWRRVEARWPVAAGDDAPVFGVDLGGGPVGLRCGGVLPVGTCRGAVHVRRQSFVGGQGRARRGGQLVRAFPAFGGAAPRRRPHGPEGGAPTPYRYREVGQSEPARG